MAGIATVSRLYGSTPRSDLGLCSEKNSEPDPHVRYEKKSPRDGKSSLLIKSNVECLHFS
eukprot:7287069-Prymnesium_polylepis.1